MSHQERASAIALVTGVLLNVYVAVRLVQLFGSGALAGADAPVVWARAIVWVIPAAIVLTVLLHVLVAVVIGRRAGAAVVDERDRQFRLRGMAITLYGTGLGFTAMVVALAAGGAVVTGLTLLYASIAIGDVAGNAVRLGSYRVGA